MEYEFLLILAAALFSIGFLGLVVRKNLLVVLMCLELMLNAINLTFVTFAHRNQDFQGQLAVFFIMTVAAAEAAVGLSLVIVLFRKFKTVESDQIDVMKG